MVVTVDYRIEIYDTWGRRVAVVDETPLLEAVRTAPDRPDRIAGLLPAGLAHLGHGYRIRVFVDGRLFCEASVVRVAPHWSDTRKLILDRYVRFHELLEVEAERAANDGNTAVSRCYVNGEIGELVRSAIDSATGRVHYLVDHAAYPDGAQREYAKFEARRTAGNALFYRSIALGQWAGPGRVDATGAYAKDGDTIAGLVVDGIPWPDLRLMLIDCEETSKNSHAVKRHPEVAGWTAAQYAASGYKLEADAATAALQNLIDTKGIEYVELNPHQNAAGAFDDRVDAYGRYVGLAYGGGECFNAALVELGLADVYLYQDGAYLVPDMALKDFFSYAGPHAASVDHTGVVLTRFDVSAGVFEALTALAYAAGGHLWSVDPELAVTFRAAGRPDRVCFFDPAAVGVTLGSDSEDVANALYFNGNPMTGGVDKTYTRDESIDEFGFRPRQLRHYGISVEEDADRLCLGILEDLAYPDPGGAVEFFHGDGAVRVGDLVEIRGEGLRRVDRELPGEWGGRFTGRLVARVEEVRHRFSGRQVATRIRLTSPLRSVADPLRFMVASQPSIETLYQFRLDDEVVGVDLGYHLD
ncbi:MAG: thermonuclease family protein [Candidatus Hydrogenedentes bacterium]|nr:thermonuclease family protein [Candidatus Hydrogenedentota bacterium]